MDNEEFELLLSDLTDNIFQLYKSCNQFNFEVNSNDVLNQRDINPDEHFYYNMHEGSSESLYYLDDEFISNFATINTKSLSIIHFNCRSLNAHYSNINSYLDMLEYKFDVIALSETWLNIDDTNVYNIDEYDMYTSSRTNKNGGGVAIYVRNIFENKVLDDLTSVIDNCMESIGVEIILSKKKSVWVQCI